MLIQEFRYFYEANSKRSFYLFFFFFFFFFAKDVESLVS